MMLAAGFIIGALAMGVYILTALVPKRDTSKRSKERALSRVQVGRHGSYSEEGLSSQPSSDDVVGRPAEMIEAAAFVAAMNTPDEARVCHDFAPFDHATTIDYGSMDTPTQQDSPSVSGDSGPSSDFSGGESSGGGSSGGWD